MSDRNSVNDSEIAEWDPGLTKRAMRVARPIVKRYYRSEVHGLELLPPGGVLVVSNHSGGFLPMDEVVFAVDYYGEFGYARPIYTLTHDIMLVGPTADSLRRMGYVHATRANAAEALRAGAVVIDFPGGDYDAYRPTWSRNTIDFGGRIGYARTAIDAKVPIVPMVSIGAQENQLFLSRGTRLARALRQDQLLHSKVLPVTFGFPFGLSIVVPVNMPLPTKIVIQVLAPIDIAAQFGSHPDAAEVDAYVRQVMQTGLDALAAQRRFPIVG
nr:lysophospholipid acyltransferase family protein [Mycobacterium kansasii]